MQNFTSSSYILSKLTHITFILVFFSTTLFNILFRPAVITALSAPPDAPAMHKIEVSFIIDSTGSMGKYIINVRNNLQQFVNFFSEQGYEVRFNLITYKDITAAGEQSSVIYRENYSPWYDGQKLSEFLTQVEARGGDDELETLWDGLGFLTRSEQIFWSSDSIKFALVLTDAKSKNDNRHGFYDLSDLTSALTARHITTSVITRPENYSYYEPLTAGTGGILADISQPDFNLVLKDLAIQMQQVLQQKKQAIYILPGYMGSRLYDSSGQEIWAQTSALINDITRHFLPGGEKSVLAQDENSQSLAVTTRPDLDRYGSQDTYQLLVDKLESELGADYDIVFFPYRWLGDLNQSARELAAHIDRHQYQQVTFVTHSTGGLLAANYLALDPAHKLKTTQALLIAPPLYGTYSALAPLELGKTLDLDQLLAKNGVKDDFLGLTYRAVYSWIKAITHNSPTTYQLLPAAEYLALQPALYLSKVGVTQVISQLEPYYLLLNASQNINFLLTNHSPMSHFAWRQKTVTGSIVKVLQEVNTKVIGSSRHQSKLNPATVIYQEKNSGGTELKDIIYNFEGDGTIAGLSSAATGFQDQGKLPYYDFKNLDHQELATDQNVIAFIISQIKGETELLVASHDSMALGGTKELLKIEFQSTDIIDVEIYDRDGNLSATLSEHRPSGFEQPFFLYTNLAGADEHTQGLIYLPNTGYEVKFKSHYLGGGADLNVQVSTLDEMGYKTNFTTYGSSATMTGFVTLDFKEIVVTGANLNLLSDTAGSPPPIERLASDWSIEATKELTAVGATTTIDVFGSAIESGHITPQSLLWSSADEDIVSVNKLGQITAQGYGQTQIYAAAPDQSYRVQNCLVSIEAPIEKISLPDLNLVAGEKKVLNPLLEPAGASEKDIVYDYDQSLGLLRIDTYGVITALQPGTMRVTAQAATGLKTDFSVQIAPAHPISVTSIEVSSSNLQLQVGETAQLTTLFAPLDATNQNFNWYLSDERVVQIEIKEMPVLEVKAVQAGQSRLTIVSHEGGRVATALITVTARAGENHQVNPNSNTNSNSTTDSNATANSQSNYNPESNFATQSQANLTIQTQSSEHTNDSAQSLVDSAHLTASSQSESDLTPARNPAQSASELGQKIKTTLLWLVKPLLILALIIFFLSRFEFKLKIMKLGDEHVENKNVGKTA